MWRERRALRLFGESAGVEVELIEFNGQEIEIGPEVWVVLEYELVGTEVLVSVFRSAAPAGRI